MENDKIEKQREANRRSYHKYRDQRLANRKEISEEAKALRAAYQKQWREKNRDRLREFERNRWAIRGPKQNERQRELRKTRPREEQYRLDSEHWFRRQYGRSVEWYDGQLASQGGHCALCPSMPENRRLHVDHNHKCCGTRNSCGKCVRGLLCARCNMLVGFLEELLGAGDWMERAKTYLNSFEENQ
jgi:hypothetical protein